MGEGLTSVQQITRENAKKQIVLALREVNRAGPLMKALTNTYALRYGTSAHAPFGRDGGAIIPHPKLAKYTWARRLYEISQEDCAILDVNAPKLDTSLTLFQILVQTEGHLIKENQYPRHPLQKESQEKHYKNIYAKNIKNIAYKLQPLWELGLTHVHQIWEKGRPREVREIIIERNNQDNDKEFNKECIVLIERRRKALEYVTGVLLRNIEAIPQVERYVGKDNVTDSSRLIRYRKTQALPIRYEEVEEVPYINLSTMTEQNKQRASWNTHPCLRSPSERWKSLIGHQHELHTRAPSANAYPTMQKIIYEWAHLERFAITRRNTSYLKWCTHTNPISFGMHFRAAVYELLEANFNMHHVRTQMLSEVETNEWANGITWHKFIENMAEASHPPTPQLEEEGPTLPGLLRIPKGKDWKGIVKSAAVALAAVIKDEKEWAGKHPGEKMKTDEQTWLNYVDYKDNIYQNNLLVITIGQEETVQQAMVRTLNTLEAGWQWAYTHSLLLFSAPPEYKKEIQKEFTQQAGGMNLSCERISIGKRSDDGVVCSA